MSWREPIRQVAALPYRPDPDGNIRVMLITSRETQRWVIPKGNLIKGLRAHEAAAQEAFEEAGVEGIACPTPDRHLQLCQAPQDRAAFARSRSTCSRSR